MGIVLSVGENSQSSPRPAMKQALARLELNPDNEVDLVVNGWYVATLRSGSSGKLKLHLVTGLPVDLFDINPDRDTIVVS